jgi:hypothetical protein
MGGAFGTYDDNINAYRVLVRKREGESPPRITRRRLGVNMKTNPTEIEWDGLDCIYLAQNRGK